MNDRIFDACYNELSKAIGRYDRSDSPDTFVDFYFGDYIIQINYHYQEFWYDWYEDSTGYHSSLEGRDFYIEDIEVIYDDDDEIAIDIDKLEEKVRKEGI